MGNPLLFGLDNINCMLSVSTNSNTFKPTNTNTFNKQDLFPSSFLFIVCNLARLKLLSLFCRLASFKTPLIFYSCCFVVDTEDGLTGFLYVHVQNGKNFLKTTGMHNGILLEK